MDEPVDTVFDLNERTEVRDITDLAADLRTDRIAGPDRIPRVLLELLHAEADPLVFGIDTENLHFDLITLVEHAFRARRAFCP